MATCFYLCPNSAFAIASRWNDRAVGHSGRMFAALLEAALNTNAINPSSAWAAAALPFDYDLVDFAGKCIANETNTDRQQIIFNDLVANYRQRGTVGDKWRVIDKLAKSHRLHHDTLDQLELLIGNGKEVDKQKTKLSLRKEDNAYNGCDTLYGDINFLSDDGLRKAKNRFEALKGPREFDGLWKYVTSKVSNTNATRYLMLVVNAEYLDFYDIRTALRYFPEVLKKKVGVQKAWPNIIRTVAERFPENFIRCHYRDMAFEDFGTDEITRKAVREGILKSLSESKGLESASTFYGFVGSCLQELTTEEAEALFNYALTRFELHIDSGYADGPWRTELQPPEQFTAALTGYIWCCLGSPESNERWCATHVIRRLYRLGCQQEIDALIAWMSSGLPEAFIGKNHPFYLLHAKQYLLVALARCALDSTALLTKHRKTFSDIALFGDEHILIQKYAADIALAIAFATPTAYEADTLSQLRLVGKSSYPTQVTEDYFEERDTPWHQQGIVDTSLDLTFGHDFDRYWFEPLGRVFKVSGQQVKELATEVVLKDWRLSFAERYIRDPRQEIWNSRRDRSTWHSHSSYPRTDDYRFYLSYHALMTVAAKLLRTMPVIHSSDEDYGPLDDWLERHLLNRDDAFWLSDRRDFVPAKRRQWLTHQTDRDWRWQILSADFLDILLFEKHDATWLNVGGFWNEYLNGHNESIYISSRLVPCASSASLQKIIMCEQSNISGSKSLAHFDSRDPNGSAAHPFKLKKWYSQSERYERVDELDPFAGALDYPPISPNEEITTQLGLTPDKYQRYWTGAVDNELLLCGQLWSEDKPQQEDNNYCSRGNRLQASLKFLKVLLNKLNMDLAIQVDISRQLTGVYRENDDDVKYPPPYRKVFILSKDGKLKDTVSTIYLQEYGR